MKFRTIFNILLLTFVASATIQDANNEILGKRADENSIAKKEKANSVSKTITVTKTISRTVPTLASTANKSVKLDAKKFHNNFGDLTYVGDASWKVTKDGLYSDAVGKGDSFAFTKKKSSNFVYSTDLTFKSNKGSASLIFRSNGNSSDSKEGYVVNIDISKKVCKFYKWQKNEVLDLIDEKKISSNKKRTYSLKVVAYDAWILFYVNDELMASTGDYIVQVDDKGQDTFIDNGVFGLLNSNSKVVFQNTYYKNLKGKFNPILNDIEITSKSGTVEKKATFVPTEPVKIQYVKNDASTIRINTSKVSSKAKIEIIDDNGKGKSYKEGQDIPVKVGINYLVVKSTVTSSDGMSATATYRMNVHRFKEDSIYYNEDYRDQYHYSVKEGWDNDPNGLVYFNGKYHLFYQFYDDIVWGPMHWAHATSKDLLHWEEEPIALYPDANGAMFSGSIVADVNNTSGLFGNGKGGLVAFIAVDGNGQRIKVAYSKDEGIHWNKIDNIALDWTEDPLQSVHFRDPKVFRWEGKWFMAIAGGPFRLYSSDNLLDWDLEYTNPDVYTECPDLYPVKASDGKIKWVLVGSKEFPGRKRFYKVGDFKKVNGKWNFIMDKDYEGEIEGSTTFGKDSYATMTYYVQDFGTEANPTLPEILELNWMNSWEYSKILAKTLNQDYAGTFSLNLKVGLIKEGDKYLLTESPIKNYNDLRIVSKAKKYENVKLGEKNDLLKKFKGEMYEIIAKFVPSKGTKKVGFRLRTGGSEETLVYYDVENEKILIDRSKSGIILNDQFKDVDSREMTLNKDGSVDMHIYVDRSSIELFTKDDTINAANQIFTKRTSLGASVLIEGEEATADITIYPLKGIWNNGNNNSEDVEAEASEESEEEIEGSTEGAENEEDSVEEVDADAEEAEDSADEN